MGVVDYLTVEGEILSETRNGIDSDYVPDPLGSTAKLVTAGGVITDTFLWWPYGELRSHVGNSLASFGYAGTLGYYSDLATGLDYVRARWISAALARWQTADPFWPEQLAYAYTGSNPATRVDPSGLASCLNPPNCAQALADLPPWVAVTLCPSCVTCYKPIQGDPPGIETCVKVHEKVHCHQLSTGTATVFCNNGLLYNRNHSAAECPAMAAGLACLLKTFGPNPCAKPSSPQCKEARDECLQLSGGVGYPTLSSPPLRCSGAASAVRTWCKSQGYTVK